jgi:hypothetical protein
MNAHKMRLMGSLAAILSLGVVTGLVAMGGEAYASGTVYYQQYDSGYQVYSSTVPPATVAVTFKVPLVSDCTSTEREIGLGPLVEDASGDAVESWVQLGCDKGKAVYSAGYSILGTGAQFGIVVHPHDSITQTNSMNATQSSVTFTDNTTGASDTITGSADTAAYGYIGSTSDFNGKGKLTGVPDFSTVSMTDAEINGAGIGTYTTSTGLAEWIRTTTGTSSGTVQIQPGTLHPSSFKLTFRHN